LLLVHRNGVQIEGIQMNNLPLHKRGKTLFNRLSEFKTLTILAGFCIVITLVLLAIFRAKALGSNELLSVEPPVFNLGTIFQAQTISREFSLSNRSEQAIRIVAVKSTCSCTIVRNEVDEVIGKVILPGGHLMIPVDYSVRERKGPVSSFVSIFFGVTNDMQHLFEVQAHMEGVALPEFTLKPDTIDFGDLKPGEQCSKTVTFLPGQEKNLKISDPVSAVEAFRVSLQQKKEDLPEASWVAVITFKAPTNVIHQETLSEIVRFKTSSERVPQASIYVVGNVIPDVEITPTMIIVPSSGLVKGGQNELIIHTSQLSRIEHLISKGLNTSLDIQTSNNPATMDGWDKIHHLRIPNTLLAQAIGVDVELEVHSGADRIEARSVFVPIKSLYSPTKNEKNN
jgi:hypothetical protein